MRPLALCLGLALSVRAGDLPLPHYSPCSMAGNHALIGYPTGTTQDGRITIKVESWVHGSNRGDTITLRPSFCSFLPGQRVLVYAGCWNQECLCNSAKLADLARDELAEFETLRTGRNIVRGTIFTVSRDETPKPPRRGRGGTRSRPACRAGSNAGRRQLRNGRGTSR